MVKEVDYWERFYCLLLWSCNSKVNFEEKIFKELSKTDCCWENLINSAVDFGFMKSQIL